MRRWLTTALAAGVAGLLPVAAASAQQTPAQKALGQTLSGALRRLGGATGAEVFDSTAGTMLFAARPQVRRLPASVEKIYTTSTALQRFGPSGTLTTSIYGAGTMDSSHVWHGTLYLRGGGDPTFGSARYDSYAYGSGATIERLVTNLVRQTGITGLQGAIVGDESLFDSLRGTVATGYALSSEVEGELSALAYDRGFTDIQGSTFQARPAQFAAARLRDALRAAHVRLVGRIGIRSGRIPLGATPLTVVHSPRMATLARLTNTPSDNFLAEMLIKGIGARFGGRGSTAAGAAVVAANVAISFGIHPQIVDGSGLSRGDHTSPAEVVSALRALASNPAFVNSLAVAGVSGTMASGFSGTAAQGRCRGKTGTLHDVANLVGYCTARDGHQLVFAFLLNGLSDPNHGHAVANSMAVAVAKYDG